MAIINYNEQTFSNLDGQLYNKLKIGTSNKNSETLAFLKDLYTYPPKFKIVWEQLTELNPDTKNSGTVSDLTNQNQVSTLDSFTNGYLNKVTSSNFYNKKTNSISTALKYIPVYVVLNGRGEIVVSHSNLDPKAANLNAKIYDLCGSFDPRFNRAHKLGLIFFNRADAEFYLREIASIDPQGTDRVGLSIHCIGLDSAYTLLRNYYSDFDFRFVPNFDEVNRLLDLVKKGDSKFIFDKNQYKPKYNTKTVGFSANLFHGLPLVKEYISPIIQNNEYFKGVPIYIVQVHNTSPNIYSKGVSNISNSIKSISRIPLKLVSLQNNFQQKWILEGKLKNCYNLSETTNYICFNKDQAIQLTEQFGQNIASSVERKIFSSNLFHEPKIYISNLEDFVEMWDEFLLNESPENNASSVHFIPSAEANTTLEEYYNAPKRSLVKRSQQFLRVKFNLLVELFGLLLNNN
jgi:hypothetical protein